ncbi:hypothetical protein RSOL_299120, partial [Rhizoctonia solani AG-3 Rhs1AP]
MLDCTRSVASIDESQGMAAENQACVTIPPEMEHANQVFHCPKCLSEGESRKINYVINRGARLTMRLVSKTSLTLIVYYLRLLKTYADALVQQLQSSLAALEVNIALRINVLTSMMHEAEATEIHEQLSRNDPYHLAVVIMTESHPGGGWWHTSDKDRGGKGQVSEKALLGECLDDLRPLAERAITARVYMVSCGVNLPGKGIVKDIHDYLYPRPYHSILMPSVYMLTVPDFTNMLPELFVHLYYFGAPFRASVLRVWAVDREARAHTGIVTLERVNPKDAFRVIFDVRWKLVKRMDGFGDEKIVVLNTTCCQTQLRVAISPGRRREFTMHGTTVTEETWDHETMTFEFTEYNMVAMETLPPRGDNKHPPPALDVPWTRAGHRFQRT